MRLTKYFAVLPLFLLSVAALAATEERVLRYHHTNGRDIEVTSYVVGSYNYLQRSEYFTSGVYDRVNDIAENGVRLQQLYLSVSSLPKNGLGAFTDMAVGLDAYSIAPNGWNANMLNLRNVGFAVPDAYLYYGYHGSTLQAGVMRSLAGYESFNYLKDDNFSRGIIYGYVAPGVHMGLRGSSLINPATRIIFGLTNGWATLRQPGHVQAAELGINYQFTEKLSALLDAYIGKQYVNNKTYSGPSGRIMLLDCYGTYRHSKVLAFHWNVDYAVQTRAALPYGVTGMAKWAAIGGFANYQFADQWRTAVRGEVMNDGDGFRTGVPQNWSEVTLTLGYEPIRHLSILAEVRHDFSNVDAFQNKNGVNSNNNQQSYALEALYQFV